MNLTDSDSPIRTRRFKDTRTGDIVTKFNILDAIYMEEVKE